MQLIANRSATYAVLDFRREYLAIGGLLISSSNEGFVIAYNGDKSSVNSRLNLDSAYNVISQVDEAILLDSDKEVPHLGTIVAELNPDFFPSFLVSKVSVDRNPKRISPGDNIVIEEIPELLRQGYHLLVSKYHN